VRQAEVDNGLRPGLPTTAEREEIRKLRAENFELRRCNEILKSASVLPRRAVHSRGGRLSAFAGRSPSRRSSCGGPSSPSAIAPPGQ